MAKYEIQAPFTLNKQELQLIYNLLVRHKDWSETLPPGEWDALVEKMGKAAIVWTEATVSKLEHPSSGG